MLLMAIVATRAFMLANREKKAPLGHLRLLACGLLQISFSLAPQRSNPAYLGFITFTIASRLAN